MGCHGTRLAAIVLTGWERRSNQPVSQPAKPSVSRSRALPVTGTSAKRALGRFLGGGEPDYADSIAGRRDSVEVRTRSNTPAMPAIPAALGCSG